MKNYFFSNLSALNTDLNYAVDAASSLSGYAHTSDLSAYATETYVDTKIGDINTILDSVNGQII